MLMNFYSLEYLVILFLVIQHLKKTQKKRRRLFSNTKSSYGGYWNAVLSAVTVLIPTPIKGQQTP